MGTVDGLFAMRKNNFSLVIMLFFFCLFGLFFLYFVGNDQLEEAFPPIQFFADSNTYIKTYRGEYDNGSIIRVDGNYLGPLVVLNVFMGNNYLILLFNVIVFAVSIVAIARLMGMNSFSIGLVLLLSPLTVSSLLSVNKEIFLFPFLACALHSYLKRSYFSFFFAIGFSILMRWQLGMFYLVLMLIVRWRSMISSRAMLLLGVLGVISVVYLLVQPIIQPILIYVQFSIDDYGNEGSGLFERVLQIQNNGFYFLIFPLKALHLLFGLGFRFEKIFNPVELYNDLFVGGHCAVTFLVFLWLLLKRKISLNSDLIFIAILFLAFFCVTPIFAPRYLYFVFVLAVLDLLGAPASLNDLRIRR